MSSEASITNQIKGGLYGLLVGDALGVPYEFQTAQQIPFIDTDTIHLPLGFNRSHPTAPSGAWSDDGATALALLSSLLDADGLNLQILGANLLQWRRHGRFAVEGLNFDIGMQTFVALSRFHSGVPPDRCGPTDADFNGNGSLMRVLPLALWHSGPDSDLVQLAARQSIITHAHPRAQVCCALYYLWARRTQQHVHNAWDSAVKTLREMADVPLSWRQELDIILPADGLPRGTGSGYVVDCLHSACSAVRLGNNFAQVVRIALSFGNDTDTTACVAGGIAGIQYGFEGIPIAWRNELAGKAIVKPLERQLPARCSAGNSRNSDA